MKKKSFLAITLSMLILIMSACSTSSAAQEEGLTVLDGVCYFDEAIPWGLESRTAVIEGLGMEEADFVRIYEEYNTEEANAEYLKSEKAGQSWQGLPVKDITLLFDGWKLTDGKNFGFRGIDLGFDSAEVTLEQVNDIVAELYGLEKQEIEESTPIIGGTAGNTTKKVDYSTAHLDSVEEAYAPYLEAARMEFSGAESLAEHQSVEIHISQTEDGDIRLVFMATMAAIYNHIASR